MSRIDTLKLNADLLAMHDQPLRPDAADLNTLRDAMTVVSSHLHLEADAKRYRAIRAARNFTGMLEIATSLADTDADYDAAVEKLPTFKSA